jgi:hypothetical protein
VGDEENEPHLPRYFWDSIIGQSLLEASGRTRNSPIYLDSTQSVTLMLIYH